MSRREFADMAGKKMASFLCLVLMLVLATACVSAAGKNPAKVTGIFSDMTYNNEGGDVLGIEVFIVYSNQGYFAVYQSSEGEPSPPVVLPAKRSGTSISFTIPPAVDSRGTFTGTIDEQGLHGTFSGNGEKVQLKRKTSYWQ